MKKVTQEIKDSNVKYIMDEIEYTCKTFGDREPGSEAEAQSVAYMAEKVKNYSDDVKVETFDVYPKSFLGWLPVTLISILIGYIAYFFIPILSPIIVAFGIVLMVCRFLFYTEGIDKLFKKKTSHNLTAVKHPTGEVKRRILLNGHPDAAWEWPLTYYLGGFMNSLIPILAFAGAVSVLILSVLRLAIEQNFGISVVSGGFLYAGLALLVFLPFWLLTFFFVNFKRIVPGANDNLTACYMSIAVMKALQEAGVELEHTEIGTVITGSEEAGLRGSRAWAKKHKKDFNDVETVIITMETLREAEYLSVFHRDLNGIYAADKDVCKLLFQAGDEAGVHLGKFSVSAGATDAIGFCRNGFKAACLGGLDHNLRRNYYHNRHDDYDNLSPVCLKKAMDVVVEAIDIFDKEGLTQK